MNPNDIYISVNKKNYKISGLYQVKEIFAHSLDLTSIVVSDFLTPFFNFCLRPVSDLRLSLSCLRFSRYSGGAECFFADPLSANASSV